MSNIPTSSDESLIEGQDYITPSSSSQSLLTEEPAKKELSTRPKRVIKPPERYAPSDYNPNLQHFKRGRSRGLSPYSGVVTRSHSPREFEYLTNTQFQTPVRGAADSPLDLAFHHTPPPPLKKQPDPNTPISRSFEQSSVRSKRLFSEFQFAEESLSPSHSDKRSPLPEWGRTRSLIDIPSKVKTAVDKTKSISNKRKTKTLSLEIINTDNTSSKTSRSSSPTTENHNIFKNIMPDQILRTIAAPESVTIFKGKRRPCDVTFTPGPSISDWLRSINQYYRGTGITTDAEKIQRLPGYCDTQQGDAHKNISQLATENEGKTFEDLIKAVKVHYADSQTELDFGKLNDMNRIPLPPLNEWYDVTDMLSTVRDHARKLTTAFMDLRCNSAIAAATPNQRNMVETVLRRFIFCNSVGASLPRRAMEEKVYNVDGDRDLLTYTADIQSYVAKNYNIRDIQDASRRTNIKLTAREYYPSNYEERANYQSSSRNGGKVYAMQQEEDPSYPVINEDEMNYNDYPENEQNPNQEDTVCAFGNQNRSNPKGNNRFQSSSYQSSSSFRGGGRPSGQYVNNRNSQQQNYRGSPSVTPNAMNQNNRGNFATSIRSSDSSGNGSGPRRGDNPCYICHKRGHRFTQCGYRPRFSDLGGGADQCQACFGYDHAPHHHSLAHQAHGPIRVDDLCEICNGVAHLADYCPAKLAEKQANVVKNQRNRQRPQSQSNFHQTSGRNRPPN